MVARRMMKISAELANVRAFMLQSGRQFGSTARGVVAGLPKIQRVAGLTIVLALALVACVSGPVGATKPLPPISVNWKMDSTPGVDGAQGLTVTVDALASMNVQVEVTPSRGVALTKGTQMWKGKLAPGNHPLDWRMKVGQPGTVVVVITASSASNMQQGVHYRETITIRVPEGVAVTDAPPAVPEPVLLDGVLVYPAK